MLLAAAMSLTIVSCNKGEDFIDSTSSFPFGWKSVDSFDIIGYNIQDTLGGVVNQGSCPLGVTMDASFGLVQSSFYTNFQTTLSSTNFTFAQVDSIVLVLPFLNSIPKYGATNAPMNISVYELTEALETSSTSRKQDYSYSATPIGTKIGYQINTQDSITEILGKIGPAIRIPLDISFANKIIAKGSYVDDAEFQSIIRGVYVTCDQSPTNGFAMIALSTDLKIRIYGKNSTGSSVASDVISGGVRTTTVNRYSQDVSSAARTAALNANKTTGDAKLYCHGLYGYYSSLVIPSLSNFYKDKEVFKAELTLYSIDTGLVATSDLGFLFIDSLRSMTEVSVLDDLYSQRFRVSVKDTMISGTYVRRYVYNLGMHLNAINSKQVVGNTFHVYPSAVIHSSSASTKISNLLPSRLVLAGNMQPLKPKLTLYYVDKK